MLETERRKVVKYGRLLLERKLTTGTGGNLSVFNREKELMVISPSARDYLDIEPEDTVVMNLKEEVIASSSKPSSEYQLHLLIYQERPDVRAVVHTHSVNATAISCLNEEIPPLHYLIGFAGDKLPRAEYALFGTRELAENAVRSLGSSYNATLLDNHGLLAVGRSLQQAFQTAEMLEYVAELYVKCRSMGEPALLNEAQMKKVKEKFDSYLHSSVRDEKGGKEI